MGKKAMSAETTGTFRMGCRNALTGAEDRERAREENRALDRELFKERAAVEEKEARDAYWHRVEKMTCAVVSDWGMANAWIREDASVIVDAAVDLVNEIDARRAREGGSK
jgi:hypothetical protein